jgi:hypothetical protein
MEHITTMMTELQQSLQRRHDVIAANMDRIDSPRITSSIQKLKSALQELQTRNAHLVMRNEKLNRQLSFMPPEMWDVVAEATKRQSPRYEQQWVDPHYLHPSAGEYMFIRHEPDSGIVAQRMQRCASLTSVKDVLLEADEVLEYLKCHNGIVDQPINENNNIVEDATDMHGVIPSANEIVIPTVVANPAMRLRMVQNILPNDIAPKRTHSTVPLGHNVQPTKVPKPNPQASLSTSSQAAPAPEPFSRMTLHQQNAYLTPGYRANSYDYETPMDDSNPFSPLPRQVVKYNVYRDNNSSSDNSSQNNSRWNSSMQVRSKGKGKGKG